MSFRLEIVSPVSLVFEGEVDSVTVPGTLGSFQVLQNHAPMISSFDVGKVMIRQGGNQIEYTTGGGVFEVKDNKAVMLAESVESKEQIDIERANRSRLRAEEMLHKADATQEEKEEARHALERALNRIKLAQGKN